uniref:Uncharacterized protein n=1 Tax=Odontella aurita TaxID=265563 RepID=A0A7S4MYN5_9STRA
MIAVASHFLPVLSLIFQSRRRHQGALTSEDALVGFFLACIVVGLRILVSPGCGHRSHGASWHDRAQSKSRLFSVASLQSIHFCHYHAPVVFSFQSREFP